MPFADPGYWLQVSPPGAGVYVYIEKGRVWYIGKTINLLRRLQHHHWLTYGRLKNIIHKVGGRRLVVYPCEDPFMSFMEAFLIYCFDPPGNSVKPSKPIRAHSQEDYDRAYLAMLELKELT